MAKLSAINKNNKRIKLANRFFKKRQSLKKIIMNKNLYMGPKIYKVVINMGLGLDGNDSKILKSC